MNKGRAGRLALLLAALALLLCGCADGVQERPMADLSQRPMAADKNAPAQDESERRTGTVLLYFLSESGTSLVPVPRAVTAEGGESLASAALRALLDGPYTDEAEKYGVQWPEMNASVSVQRLERSGSVATVDLPARVRELPQEQIFFIRQAVTNTLTEFSEISYVNVLIGGREEGLDLGASVPVGTMTRTSDLDVAAQYSLLNAQRQGGAGFTRLTTLYLPSEDGRMLLPQVRSVTFAQNTPIEVLYTMLGELGRVSGDDLTHGGVPAPLRCLYEMPEIVRTEDGAYRAIELHFGASLDEALEKAGLTRAIYLAMLTDTLMGIVPGVDGLQVFIGEEQVAELSAEQTPDGTAIVLEGALATRDAFGAFIGAPCTLYAGTDDGRLRRVRRVIAQSGQDDLRVRLVRLMALSQEEDVFALPDGLVGEDVLAVASDGEKIRVNLSARFARALEALSAQQARVAVYAMVNTLTEGGGAQRVRFYFEGSQMEAELGGLEMRGAFARNPGMSAGTEE